MVLIGILYSLTTSMRLVLFVCLLCVMMAITDTVVSKCSIELSSDIVIYTTTVFATIFVFIISMLECMNARMRTSMDLVKYNGSYECMIIRLRLLFRIYMFPVKQCILDILCYTYFTMFKYDYEYG